eukprot:1664436-Amphidinium_carterae.1
MALTVWGGLVALLCIEVPEDFNISKAQIALASVRATGSRFGCDPAFHLIYHAFNLTKKHYITK